MILYCENCWTRWLLLKSVLIFHLKLIPKSPWNQILSLLFLNSVNWVLVNRHTRHIECWAWKFIRRHKFLSINIIIRIFRAFAIWGHLQNTSVDSLRLVGLYKLLNDWRLTNFKLLRAILITLLSTCPALTLLLFFFSLLLNAQVHPWPFLLLTTHNLDLLRHGNFIPIIP